MRAGSQESAPRGKKWSWDMRKGAGKGVRVQGKERYARKGEKEQACKGDPV